MQAVGTIGFIDNAVPKAPGPPVYMLGLGLAYTLPLLIGHFEGGGAAGAKQHDQHGGIGNYLFHKCKA